MITWGIIGCGDVTEIKSGPAFNKVRRSRLLAVMRRNSMKAEDYARRHHVPLWFNDAQMVIDHPDVNAIYVATPPSSHEEYAIAALKAGKYVYLEKPMSINSASAQNIANVTDQTGGKLSVAHYRRQQPMFLRIKALLHQGILGKIREVKMEFHQPYVSPMIAQTEENWRLNPGISGGGLFHDLAPHQLDLMLLYFGRAMGISGRSSNVAGLYEVPDTVSVEMRFENDIDFSGHWAFTSLDKIDNCEVFGTKGSIRFSVFERNPLMLTINGKQEIVAFEPLEHVQLPMIAKVVDYFLNDAANPCSAADGVEVMRMIDAVG